MVKYKTVRISDTVLSDIHNLQDEKASFISAVDALIDLFNESSNHVWGNFEKEDGRYIWDVAGYCREYNNEEPLKNVIRIPEEVFNKLEVIRAHPDESFNTILFRVVTMEMAVRSWNEEPVRSYDNGL